MLFDRLLYILIFTIIKSIITLDYNDITYDKLNLIQSIYYNDSILKSDDKEIYWKLNNAKLTVVDTRVRSSIYSIVNKNTNLIDKPLPILFQTSNLNFNSFGNSFSEYIESYICSNISGLHYIDISRSFNDNRHPFFKGFPITFLNTNPVRIDNMSDTEIKSLLNRKCPCPSICHEWSYGLLHHYTHIVREIFLLGVKSHIDSLDLFNKTYLSFYQVSNKYSKVYYNKSQYYSYLDSSIEISNQLIFDINSKLIDLSTFPLVKKSIYQLPLHQNDSQYNVSMYLPYIPDVSIHYRCSDNIYTHYGLTHFRTLAKYIPMNSKTIYIMSESIFRHNSDSYTSRCSAIFDSMLNYLSERFPNSYIVLLRGNNIFDDMIRLTLANTTICSVSTYCLYPAIANNNTVYFPRTKLIAKAEINGLNYPKSFHWMNNDDDTPFLGKIAITLKLNQLINELSKENL